MQPRDRHTWKIEDRKISTTPANRVGGFKTRQPFCKMKTALAQPEYQRWIKSSRRFNYDKSVLWFFVSASSTLITRCINLWPTVSFHNYVSYDIKSLKEKKKEKKRVRKERWNGYGYTSFESISFQSSLSWKRTRKTDN